MTTYTNPFTGQTISPSQVGYEALTISTSTILQWPINGTTSNNVVANIIEVTATTTGLSLILPSALQVSVGQAAIIRNIGSNAFTVTDAGGNTIASVASGQVDYVYVTDNTTTNGAWGTVAFGAGTSAANAATLAGLGLIATGTTLNQQYAVQTYASSTTLLQTARAQMNVWTGGVGTITLPSTSTVGANWFTIIKNDGTGILTITPTGSNAIDNNANSVSIQLQLAESLVLVSDGTNTWYTFGYGRSNLFAYTQLALTLTGGTTTLSSTQAANTIQEYTGTLTSNQIVVVPSTVQLYTFTNNTTGAYTLTIKTAVVGGATVSVAQGNTILAICDGTNLFNANSVSASSAPSLTLPAGSVATPTLNFISNLTTGLYLPGSNQVGVAVGGANAATFTSTGVLIPVGIGGGTF